MPESATRAKRLEPEERRESILDVAQELFSQRGFEQVNVADVASAAGVARPLIHHYFGSKRGLYLAVAQRFAADAGAGIEMVQDAPLEELVPRNVDAWLGYFEANRVAVTALLWSEGPEPGIDDLFDRAREAVIDSMAINHFGTSEVPESVRFVLRGYTGLVRSAMREWLLLERATREEVRALMINSLFCLVREVIPTISVLEPRR
jgi:AcrR family transcriptional regulator